MMYVNGQWMEAASGQTFDVYNPATGTKIGSMPYGNGDDADRAIEAAHDAFPTWSALTADERSVVLLEWYRLIREQTDVIARILTTEQGKPLSEAKAEVEYAAKFVEWYAEEGKRVYGSTIPSPSRMKRIIVTKQPVGVVAAIAPWNFPAAMITRKIAPALAAGCTCVLKPSELTPMTAKKLVELLEQAGCPKGVVNMVMGDAKSIGARLMSDSRVRKVTFTGSTEVGKLLMRQAADTVKNVSLELGGHSPYIVFDDANVEKAVKGAVSAKFRNAGQACTSINRIFVHERIADAFIEQYRSEIRSLKIGDGTNPETNVGPLIDHRSFEKVKLHVKDALDKGAQLVSGGEGFHQGESEHGGYFFQPTVLSKVTPEMKIMNEEVFGPVAPITLFSTEEEVLRMANNTSYGLVAYLFTESLSRAVRVGEKLEYGILGINDAATSAAQAPFGGFKESGLGREGGQAGIECFLETKYMSISI